MSFMESVRTCFSKFATFEGRARRTEFWMFYLFSQIIAFVGYVIAIVVLVAAGFTPLLFAGADEDARMTSLAASLGVMVVVFGIYILVMLVLTIPYLAVSARRLHDMGQSAHWLWLNLIGFGIVPVVMAFFDSQWGPNRWGDDPKASERSMYVEPQPYGYSGHPHYGHAPHINPPQPPAGQ